MAAPSAKYRSGRTRNRRLSVSIAGSVLTAVISGVMSPATSAFVVSPASARHRGARLVFDTTESYMYSQPFAALTNRITKKPTTTTTATTTILSMVAKSGGREILSTEQFADEVLSADLTDSLPVLVFYSAPWCGPCRLSNPVVKDVMKQFAGQIDVVEVCTDDLPDVAAEAGVVSIPTIQIFYGGELLDTIVGCVARNVLASAVSKVLEEDVGANLEDEELG